MPIYNTRSHYDREVIVDTDTFEVISVSEEFGRHNRIERSALKIKTIIEYDTDNHVDVGRCLEPGFSMNHGKHYNTSIPHDKGEYGFILRLFSPFIIPPNPKED